jgi:parallel beta-helix repeat protein
MRNSSRIICLFLSALAGAHLAKNDQVVFQGDTVINQNIEIPESLACTIMPGTTMKFNGYYTFVVRGVIIACGTEKKPIIITGLGRQRGSTERSSWAGLQIIGPSSSALFRHCRIEGAFKNIVWEAKPLFDSCEFVGNHYALYCTKKSTAHVRACDFHRNVYGIVVDYATPLLLGNTISENTVGVYLQLSAGFVSGRNLIVNNETDIKSDSSLGPNSGAFSVHYLWDLMRQMY